VEDIISRGEDRPPGRWRRRLVLAAAVVVIGALVLVEHLPHGHSAPRRNAGSASGHVPEQSGFGRLRVEGPATLPPSGITGNVASWGTSARLPRTGAQPEWFWPAEGRFAPILGLPDDRFGYVFTRILGGWAIQPDPPGPAGCGNCTPLAPPGQAGCGDCTRPPAPVLYLADRARRATFAGSASLVAPAAASGTMWLTSYPPGSDLATTPGTAQQYTGTGRPAGAAVRLPAGYGITQGTSRGLLLVSLSLAGPGNSDRLWDPATGKVLRSFDGVVAVSATEVAYEPPCQATCPVHVANLETGRNATIGLPIAETVITGRFSPDGRFLALQVSVPDTGALAMQLEVASLPAGHVYLVPHTFVSSDALDGFGWPGRGDFLVAEFSFSSRVQMALWAPGGPSLAVADLRPSEDPTALVVG
jgi:hypothetical protein